MPKSQGVPVSTEGVLELLPPFPIVLVTTRTNIITIGQLEYFTFEPLRLGIAIAHSRWSHGLVNEEREFVVHVQADAAMESMVNHLVEQHRVPFGNGPVLEQLGKIARRELRQYA